MAIRQPWWRSMGLYFSLMALMVISEVVVRMTLGVPRSEKLPLLRVQPDPNLGYRPIPGDEHYGYDEFVILNAQGFRGGNIAHKKQKEYRLLVLGGTQVYGLGIADDSLLSRVLESRLNQQDSQRSYRVLNLGVRGYTLVQQHRLLRDVGLALNPDHVIVVLDIHTLVQMNPDTYYQRIAERDWFMLDLDSKPNGLALGQWCFIQIARKSALIAWLYSMLKAWREQDSFTSKLLRGITDSHTERDLFSIAEQIDAFKAMASQHKFSFSLALLPVPAQVSHSKPPLTYQAMIRDVAREREIRFLDLFEPLRQLYVKQGWLPVAPFDGHYDAHAHQAIGHYLFESFQP